MFITLVIVFLLSLGIALILTPLVRSLAIKYGYVDNPNRNHPAITHSTSIPRAGGVAMFISFAIVSLLFASIDNLLIGILVAAGLNVAVGTLDDKYDISPVIRLCVQVLSGVIVVIAGVDFYMSNPFQSGLWYFNYKELDLLGFFITVPADILLIIWLIIISNTINWTKGASQLPGVAVIALITIAGVALQYQAGNPYQEQTALLAIIAAGAVLSFLPYNFPPEKMFPGFGASTFIGFIIAILAVLSGGKFATILIVLAIPIIDAFLVGMKRILTGHNPLKHDREHLYHFLMNAGFSKRQIIFFYWITALLFGLTAIYSHSVGKIIAIVTLTILITIFFVYLYFRNK